MSGKPTTLFLFSSTYLLAQDSDSSDSEESSNHPSAARRQPLPSGGRVAFAAVKAFFTSLYREPEEFAHRG